MQAQDFMTKTRIIARDNGSPADNLFLVAIDVGYSAVKVFSPTTVAMFPSYAVPDRGSGIAGQLGDDSLRYRNDDTGEAWFVGKMAHDILSDDDTSVSETALYGRDRYNDPMFQVIVQTGLGLACMRNQYGSSAGKTICIQTGLPPRYMGKGARDREELIGALSGSHRFSLQIGHREPVHFDLEIKPENVQVMAQPMGTLFSVAAANDHTMVPGAVQYFNKNVLIFDGGFGTLDIYPIKAHVIQPSETYDNLGMRRVLEETASLISDRFHKEISVPAMQKYLEKGTFRWFEAKSVSTRDEPLDEILEECSRKVCQEALTKLMQVCRVYEYDYLVVTGGTGEAWIDQIRDYFKNMETLSVVSGAQNDTLPGVFANVRGYFMFRYSDLQAAARKAGGKS